MQINKFHSDTISRMMEHTQRCQQSNEERERRNEIYRQSCTEGTRELPLASILRDAVTARSQCVRCAR